MLRTGRILYAVAMLGFGALCFGYVDYVNQLQPIPAWFPGRAPLSVLTGAFLVAVGSALLANLRVPLAAGALAIVFSSWVALQVPSAIADPSLLRSPWWIRTFETVAMIGAALVLVGLASDPGRPAWATRGRIAYGISLPVFGILHMIYPPAALVPPIYPWPMFWAYFTGAAMIMGGLAIATGVLARPAATLIGVMYAAFFLTLHIPRSWCRAFVECEFLGTPPVGLGGSRAGLTSLFVALAMWGGAWIVARSPRSPIRKKPPPE